MRNAGSSFSGVPCEVADTEEHIWAHPARPALERRLVFDGGRKWEPWVCCSSCESAACPHPTAPTLHTQLSCQHSASCSEEAEMGFVVWFQGMKGEKPGADILPTGGPQILQFFIAEMCKGRGIITN